MVNAILILNNPMTVPFCFKLILSILLNAALMQTRLLFYGYFYHQILFNNDQEILWDRKKLTLRLP